MQVRIFPKSGSNYLVQFDRVLTVVSERSMVYLQAGDSYSDHEGWSFIKDMDAILLPNDVIILVQDKQNFIGNLNKSIDTVEKQQKSFAFKD